MEMIEHSQSTQSNKFAIPLQYLKKKLGMELVFCMQKNIKVSTSWHYRFLWKWLDISKVPKIGSWQYFCNWKKKFCNCFCILLWCKTFRYFTSFSRVRCYLFLGSCAQKWARPLRSWDCKTRCISEMIWKSSRFIEWFLHADSNWIIFGFTTSLLCTWHLLGVHCSFTF